MTERSLAERLYDLAAGEDEKRDDAARAHDHQVMRFHEGAAEAFRVAAKEVEKDAK